MTNEVSAYWALTVTSYNYVPKMNLLVTALDQDFGFGRKLRNQSALSVIDEKIILSISTNYLTALPLNLL